MVFYDGIDLSNFKLLSKIPDDPFVAEPCPEFLQAVIEQKKSHPEGISIAEVGIGLGATTLATSLLLSEEDRYYCFDLATSTEALAEDLQKIPDIKCKIILLGNSNRVWDSYNWALSDLAIKMHLDGRDGIFDAVYLDGAHVFIHDALATCLIKQLVKPGGIFILDDVPIKVTDFNRDMEFLDTLMTPEQIATQQVLRVQEIFLSHDPNFECLSKFDEWRSVFRRKV